MCYISIENVGIQNEWPQDMPLWHVNYFELNATEASWAQKKFMPSLNYLEEFILEGLPISDYQRELLLAYLQGKANF